MINLIERIAAAITAFPFISASMAVSLAAASAILPAGVSAKDREERAKLALREVDLEKRMMHKPSELSGGEQQRGALARALVNRPSILFADEPTGTLDSVNGEQILLLLREFQTTLGMTIVMVTHERPLAERFADRIVMLHDGKLVSDAPTPRDADIADAATIGGGESRPAEARQ